VPVKEGLAAEHCSELALRDALRASAEHRCRIRRATRAASVLCTRGPNGRGGR
jgi:hypothetical protein